MSWTVKPGTKQHRIIFNKSENRASNIRERSKHGRQNAAAFHDRPKGQLDQLRKSGFGERRYARTRYREQAAKHRREDRTWKARWRCVHWKMNEWTAKT